ncbi:MAG: phytanoyl-CoA dioxygenase [Rickettsiales bacterium]|nr:phytanoyl-CoA dioxygenase [Rickettsiales bacterium]|tara:strand:- start:419 stop:1273 length:855 start_codon:yes stop_codon:yes gene_type:complete
MKAPSTPITTRFTLGDHITEEQLNFLDYHGFLHFEGVASRKEVDTLLTELDRIEALLLKEGRRKINGIPLFQGRFMGVRPFIQRFAFTSHFSAWLRDFVASERFEPIRTLIGADARVGQDEKDGVVLNRYFNGKGSIYPRLGWHTDGLRDLFYLRMPKQMLNVGLHLDDVEEEDGGLRLIPGTHRQGFLDMCFRKFYFFSHAADRAEITVTTRAGDLTVHDGRLWHRVQRSSKTGEASLRRTMYVPYLTGPYEPKDATSPTPGYHRVGQITRTLRLWASLLLGR